MSMTLKNESKFVPCPDGCHEAVCVDIVDLGIVSSRFGDKHKLKFVWEVDQKMKDGRPFTVQQRYTWSLGKKSNLRKDLLAWRGRDFTAEELKGYDLERLLGTPCRLVVVHNPVDGDVFANVTSVLTSKAKLAASGKYVRAKDRQDYVAPKGVDETAQPDVEDDEIPGLPADKAERPF